MPNVTLIYLSSAEGEDGKGEKKGGREGRVQSEKKTKKASLLVET